MGDESKQNNPEPSVTEPASIPVRPEPSVTEHKGIDESLLQKGNDNSEDEQRKGDSG